MPEHFIAVGANERLYIEYRPSFARRPVKGEKDEEEQPLIITIHGFPDSDRDGSKRVFQDIDDMILADGFAMLKFDFRGCGHSSGYSSRFTLDQAHKDMEAILRWAANLGHKRYIFIGEGLGAGLSLSHMSPRVKALVFLWPMLDPAKGLWGPYLVDGVKNNRPQGKSPDTILMDDGAEISLAFLDELKQLSLVPKLEAVRVPILVQQCDGDADYPMEQLELIRQHTKMAGRLDITTYSNGKRGLAQRGERESLLHFTQDFLKKFV